MSCEIGEGWGGGSSKTTAFQRHPGFEGRLVSPPSPVHRSTPQQAWCSDAIYTLARRSVFGIDLSFFDSQA